MSHFAVPNKLMDLSIAPQWLLISQRDRDSCRDRDRERESDVNCLLIEAHSTTYEVVMTKKKKNELESDQASGFNYQFIGNTAEEHVKGHQGAAISKAQTGEAPQTAWFLV